MSRKRIFYILFFVILFIGFYLALTKIIPGYGDASLPVLSYVQPFFFRDQNGRLISNKDVAGKVYVAEYFFTTCKGICPKMNKNLKEVYGKYRSEQDFLILSHSVDPETDSVQRMKWYADSLHVDSGNWLFLTGRKDSLYHAARVGYLLDDPKNELASSESQFIHTQFFALVDKTGRVRKIYDGLKKDEINALESDIRELLKEKAVANQGNADAIR